MRASIVITTFERPLSLSRCLEALHRQKGIEEAEVIVVDDGSEGEFKAIARIWKPRLNFQFLKIPHRGRSAARNRAVREASARRIIFLGDDVMVRPGWLGRHLVCGQDDRSLAVLGPCPLDSKSFAGKPPSAAFLRFADPARIEHLIKDRENMGFAFFATGNLSMDRSLFQEIGGFDERFTRYGWEDIDLGYRFERAGGRLIYDDRAKALHAHPAMSHGDLWDRELSAGITAYQFWSKWQTEELTYMKFWREGDRPGPAWRRAVGRAALGFTERVAPNSAVLDSLYERLVYSYRHAGVAEGRRLYGDSMQRTADGPAWKEAT